MKLFLLVGLAASIFAGPITYLYTGVATGTIGESPFTDAALTVTANGNTANVTSDGAGGFFNQFGSGLMDLSIAGVGSGTFTDVMDVFVCDSCSGGFLQLQGDSTGTGGIDFFNSAFATYLLATAIGPIGGGTDPFTPWTNATSLGALDVTSLTSTFFQAIPGQAIPEPGTFVLAAAGLLMAGSLTRKHYLG